MGTASFYKQSFIEQPRSDVYTLPIAAFVFQWQSWVTDRLQPKISTMWPFPVMSVEPGEEQPGSCTLRGRHCWSWWPRFCETGTHALCFPMYEAARANCPFPSPYLVHTLRTRGIFLKKKNLMVNWETLFRISPQLNDAQWSETTPDAVCSQRESAPRHFLERVFAAVMTQFNWWRGRWLRLLQLKKSH